MTVQSIRGMGDVLPDKTPYLQKMEAQLQSIVQSYGYQEIRLPLIESTHLFKRAIGEVTDIVEKEMYTFLDRNDESMTLRPEGTAGCVRACIQHSLLHHQTQKLWYQGPMFRYERPQKGRQRQFYQMGLESFGLPNIDIEVEMLLMTARVFKQLGLENMITLEINTLGTLDERKIYRTALIEYFKNHFDVLDADAKRRLETNPLRILDSKNPDMQALINEAPQLRDYLTQESNERFNALCHALDEAQKQGLLKNYVINARLVRGLDYYNHTVFEWVTNALGAQGTVCAGGRYDTLVEQLGGNPTPAFGCAIGMERLMLLLEQSSTFTQNTNTCADIFCLCLGADAELYGRLWIETLRHNLPFVIETQGGGASFKSQFKKADKSGARLALILGEEEMKTKTVGIKFLREERPQETLSQDDVISFVTNYYKDCIES